MTANLEFQKVNESARFRGFTNLFRKENRSWWSTRRWWVNALLWPAMIGGLLGLVLFVFPTVMEAINDPSVSAQGGVVPFALEMGRSVFFELGTMALAIGAIVLCQDLIVEERNSGVTEWLLSKPVTRRAYLMAKMAANLISLLVLVVAMPSMVAYLLFSLRLGEFYPLVPFISGVGVQALHTVFYITFTLMLGVLFNGRAPILGIAFASLMGGSMIGGFFKELLYVTPWSLAKVASGLSVEMPLPTELLVYPLLATAVWCLIFTFVGIWKLERAEF